MDRPQFVYSLEIATTPEMLWGALTGQEFWRQFSGPVESDWIAGSAVNFFLPDGTLYSKGIVLQSDPPRLLSHTWPDPEGEQATECTQRLTWKIERAGLTTVKLTMVHENLTDKAYQGVSQGWPVILAQLKSVLQTARTVPIQS